MMTLKSAHDTEIEEDIRSILKCIGENPQREGLLKTPERVRKAYDEIFGGYKYDPKAILSTTFSEDEVVEDKYQQGMVIVRDIQFYSHCEHHMVPFFGKAHVAYIPNKRVVGLSKIARLVDAYARRLQIQERLGKQIADAMMEVLEPLGVMVVIEAEHMCMKMRGIKNACADTVTSVVRGAFENPEVRMEFLELLKKH